MNAPWTSHLGWTLIQFLWQGAAIAGLYSIARVFATKPQPRYVIACAALLLMIAAPFATFVRAAAPASAPVLTHTTRAVRSEWSTAPSAPVAPNSPLPLSVMPWIVMAWLTGVAFLSLRLALECIFAARLKSSPVIPAPLEYRQSLRKLTASIGISRRIVLVVSTRVHVPSVIGWLRPLILLPAGALTGMTLDQIEAILAHELAHIRRNDYLINLLQRAAEALLFYHPAVWWISREIRREREHCCDDIAVAAAGDAILYAEALANLEAGRRATLHTALAATGGSLRNRIARLLEIKQPKRDVAGVGLAAALVLILGATLLAQSASSKPTFEAASITLSPPEYVGFQSYARGDRYTALTASVRNLIAFAYGVLDFQISGGPNWASTTHYSISAKMTSPGTPDKPRMMLQSLLTDRFGLRFHRVTRSRSGYALLIDKSGPKLLESKNPGPGLGFGRGNLNGRGAEMRQVAHQLSAQLEVPIADRTGLTALYDFTLKWSPDTQNDPELPSLSTALRDQLGLRLEPVKNVPVEYFVIDHVEQPSAN
ncbi:MAG TPA: M56 family metallopeptidase [Bryobacteraceae bacterium]|nr:M56 family metallopeptidase [Bryobacteraceae bacterium]